MLSKEDQRTQAMIAQAIRPLQSRIDRLEKLERRLKSEVQQLKSQITKVTKR